MSRLRKQAKDGLKQAGKIDDKDALEHLLAQLQDGALFTRKDAVEAAWAVVDPALETHHRVHRYKSGSWGPKQADALIAADGGWYNPILGKAEI